MESNIRNLHISVNEQSKYVMLCLMNDSKQSTRPAARISMAYMLFSTSTVLSRVIRKKNAKSETRTNHLSYALPRETEACGCLHALH